MRFGRAEETRAQLTQSLLNGLGQGTLIFKKPTYKNLRWKTGLILDKLG
jgi:hypothetical protein